MKDTVMTHDIAPEFDASASPEFDASALNEENTNIADEEIVIDDTPKFDFDKFGFDKTIIRSIRKEGFTTPTPIQDMAILPLMSGLDLMGIAQTGSGKTAAFSLPVMNKLIYDYKKPEPHKPKVLILAPTRELVMQIGQFIETFSRGTPIKNLVVAGGQPYQPQIRKLKYGVDILIATPGRLIDHMGSGTIKLDQCHTFILDEADRMLDMGFIDDVKEVQKSLCEDHQTIMFSATMNDKVRRLSSELLKEPEYVEQVRKTVVADTITHKLMNVRRKDKSELLIQLLQDPTIEKALIFARTKLGADDLCEKLKSAFRETPIRVDAIHGDKKQRTREKILLNFRKGRTTVLVATDVAARGIDVEGISHVINYELPIEAENYVHRVGRTGRAGQKGLAISFCDPSDVRLLKEIERLIKIKIDVDENHPFHFNLSEVKALKGGKGKFNRNSDNRRSSAPQRDRSEGRHKSKSNRPDFKHTSKDRSDNSSEYRPEKDSEYRSEKKPEYRSEKKSEYRSEKKPEYRSEKKPEYRSEKKSDDRPANSRRPARQAEFKKPSAHKPDAKRYDPWIASKGFDDDPVVKKLRGAKPASKPFNDTKRTTGDDVKVFAKKKEGFKKKEDFKGKRDNKFAKKSDKPSFEKKPSFSKNKDAQKGRAKNTGGKISLANSNGAPQQTGGHKSFSPGRKTLRAS